MERAPGALMSWTGRSGVEDMDRADLVRALEDLHPQSFAWALGCCRRDRDDAEDVLQTVYVMVLDGRARFDGRSSVKTWLFGVVRRVAIAQARKQWIRRNLIARWFRVDDEAPADATDSEMTAKLVGALRALPGRQREVIELVFYHDMTIEQAAGVMKVGLGSARVHYDRAKKKLREILR